MSGYILCQVKRAKNPYYISNISTNIYSIEELCYYLYHNIYLLDETIINEQLLVWMKEELHLRRLYQRLYVLLEEKKNIGEFILPIFKEINYLSHDQFREMNERLKRFEEQPEDPVITTYDYEYRVNTEVITAVDVSGGQSDPDNPARVTFTIDGRDYHVDNVYYPEGDSQLAWVRWTTPDTPQDMVITVRVSGPGNAHGTINCKIVDLDQNPPPNPVADDRNDSFTPSSIPSREQKTSNYWTIWRPWWYEYWVWHGDDEDGYWCDHGWWEFDLDRYSASLSATMRITPDNKNPTAGSRSMKSGYGVNQLVTTDVSSTQSSATTPAQNAVSYFSEFNYEMFWRLLEQMGGGYNTRFEFQKNEYSTYRGRTHFTPIWYPNGSYTVNTWLIDCWTPAGMLSMNLSDSLTIRGSLWDDWHIAPLEP